MLVGTQFFRSKGAQHLCVLAGLDDAVVENLEDQPRGEGYVTQDCVVLTNGTHVKLILYRGHDDDELGPISQILSGMDHHCEGVGRFGLKDSWRTKLVNWAVALQRGEL